MCQFSQFIWVRQITRHVINPIRFILLHPSDHMDHRGEGVVSLGSICFPDREVSCRTFVRRFVRRTLWGVGVGGREGAEEREILHGGLGEGLGGGHIPH